MDFTIHSHKTAPDNSKPLLKAVEEKYGFVPNLMGEFAESPAVLEGYLQLNEAVSKTDFTPAEQQLAILAISTENRCHYCIAVHSTVLKKQLEVDEEIVDAVRNGEPLPDDKLDALVNYARTVVSERGFVSEEDQKRFLDAGYSKRNVLEINLLIGLKTISNYTNHLADTPVDETFKPEEVELEAV